MKILKAILVILFIFLPVTVSSENEVKSRYITIKYVGEDHLKRFNKSISLGSLSYLMANRKSITVIDEIKNKVDVVFERVETILEMFPKDLHITIVLLPSDEEVQKIFRSKYGKDVDFISFYSPRDKTIYISVRDIRIGVLAHEMAHAIIDLYYATPPPENEQEVLAQYVETHLGD
jgi:hypothetical protein